MICAVSIPGIRLVINDDQVEVLFHGDKGEVEYRFRDMGVYLDLESTDVMKTGWDYVSYLSEDVPILILNLDFDFRRIGHSPFVFIIGDHTTTIGQYCDHLRHVIRDKRIGSILC
jgi:hypothetical protein